MPPATAGPISRVHAKRARRREEILRAALHAFRERGYHATTLDHIAARLDLRKTALYHYFPDKEAILYQCHRDSLSKLDRILDEAGRIEGPRDQLRHVIREHVRVMTDTLQGSPLAFEVSSFPPKRRKEIIAARDRYERELRRMLERGMEDGAFRPVDAKVASFAILGAINWIARWYRPGGPLRAEEIGEMFASHLLDGIDAKAAPVAARRSPSGWEAP